MKIAALLKARLPTVDYQHRVDPKTPIEDTVRAMDKLRKEGKVKHIGLSECSAETLRKANKVAKIDALQVSANNPPSVFGSHLVNILSVLPLPLETHQVEYSLWETGPETNGLLDACKELGIALIAYSPLGRGFLSGRYKSPDDFDDNDFRKHAPRFSKEHFGKNLELVSEIDKLAKKKVRPRGRLHRHLAIEADMNTISFFFFFFSCCVFIQGCTPSQLALAWVHAQWEGIIAIPGTTNVDRLKENLGSNNVDLSKEELSEIREILNKFPPVGERYNEAFMSMVNL